VQGPIALDDLRQMRAQSILTSETQVCMEGTETWQPIETVAPTAPATPKQIAYLTYMGVAEAERMRKDEASAVLNKLFDTPDMKLCSNCARIRRIGLPTDSFYIPTYMPGTSTICSTKNFRVHFMHLSALG
jgi:GYF domain 2